MRHFDLPGCNASRRAASSPSDLMRERVRCEMVCRTLLGEPSQCAVGLATHGLQWCPPSLAPPSPKPPCLCHPASRCIVLHIGPGTHNR